MKMLVLVGNHYDMGWQHGRQVYDLRDQILLAMKRRLHLLERLPIDVRPYQEELSALWEDINRPTMDMLKGMADALQLDWDLYFRYTLASTLSDCARQPSPEQGCTSWAAAGALTREHAPILAKNRDYRPDHRKLQCITFARPTRGYAYTYLTSAGSPGVFSSGMNEMGLAVMDTHVSSLDMGPGLARYSVMMEILEKFNTVPEALDFLQAAPHLGDGTLLLADAVGEMAVFEAGHSIQGVIRPESGYVVATNHYVTPGLQVKCVDTSPAEQHGNSHKRHATVSAALQAAQGEVDIPWARRLMASHRSPQEAICRHWQYERSSVTISTIVFLPQSKTILLAGGLPCRTRFQEIKEGAGG